MIRRILGSRWGVSAVYLVEHGNAPYPAPRDPISRALYRRFERFSRFPVGRRISVEEELDGGLRAIPAPGHTLGHIAVFAPDLSAVFVGDAVWHLGPLRPSWRRFTQDVEGNADSVRRLAGMGADRVLLGHGPSISGDRLRTFASHLG
jgi:glyoxylase-like metal-dependent hydrolase (beta-lactamase superfamily II)